MSYITKVKQLVGLAVLVLTMVPAVSIARVNSLTGGLSLGLDISDRSYDEGGDDEYRRLVLTPMMQFRSLSERDSFELRAAPGIRYDLIDSNTDWDSDFNVAVDRFLTRSWQMGISNNFLRTDYYRTDSGVASNPGAPPEGVAPSTDPQLSASRGRTRYWRNTLGVFSNHFYREDSLFRFDVNYIALRNDDTSSDGAEDYDRYEAGLRDEHRFNAKWRSTLGLRYVRGDFKQTDPSVGIPSIENQFSNDLNEYYLSLALENNSFAKNPLSLSYDYVGTRYDETLRNDIDIHKMRLTWRRDFSSRLYTNLGAGPSYVKTEGQDDTWGGNGIAEVNYSVEHGFVNFQVEKKYDVDNFSGFNQNGLVDSWDTRLLASYQLLRDLTLSGRLSYIYEDRKEPLLIPGSGGLTQLEEYHNDRYLAGAVLSYTFLQFYTASLDYTFETQDSDRIGIGENYDDHRILLTISWQKELFHW